MQTTPMQSISATNEEIFPIIQAIEPILMSIPRSHAVIALLALTIAVMDPDVDTSDLQEIIQAASQYICIALESRGDVANGVPKMMLN